MFESLPESKPDAILQLMMAFRQDTRAEKLDLGVGIYKDAAGNTPVLDAVKSAEKMLLDTQTSKAYVGPVGSRPFCDAMVKQVFGADAQTDRIRCAQSNGGTGALRILADLLKESRPESAIWISDPTWPNHIPVFRAAGIDMKTYPYYDAENCEVDFDAMMSTLKQANDRDIVLLHGCCHNSIWPTRVLVMDLRKMRQQLDYLQVNCQSWLLPQVVPRTWVCIASAPAPQ